MHGIVGREPLITKEVVETILKSVENGLPDGLAANTAGIASGTIKAWKVRGKKDVLASVESLYAELYSKMQINKAKRAEKWLLQIQAHHEKDWRSIYTLLKHTYPEHYSDSAQAMKEVKRMFDDLVKLGKIEAENGS